MHMYIHAPLPKSFRGPAYAPALHSNHRRPLPSLLFLCPQNFFLFHYLLLNPPSLLSNPPQNRSSVLPSPHAIRLRRYGIQPNALADLPARDIAILQPLDIHENLIHDPPFGSLWSDRAGQEARRAGQIDAKVAEVGAGRVCEPDVDGSGGFEGGVGLSV